ncbi:MAG: CHAT domain-containing protein [Acidobacteriota bacterium]
MPNSPIRKRWAFITPLTIKVLAAVIILSLFALAACSRGHRVSDVDRGTALLLEAFEKQRLIEPRLSGGFKCGEFRPAPDDASDIDTARLAKARGLILDAVDNNDPSSQLAYARLLLSEGEKLPDALKYLRQVLEASPDNAQAHNDLGVCLIQQDKVENAIEEFETAIKLSPDLTEAVFNRALCYGRLLLTDAATAEYGRLLEIEHDKDWIAEINQRRQELSKQLPAEKSDMEIIAPVDAAIERRDLDEARRIAGEQPEAMIGPGTFELPVRYLTEAGAGKPEQAGRTLSEIELIGEQVESSMGDSSVIDLASYLRNLSGTEKEVELALLNDYLDATKAFFTREYEDGQSKFARLAGLFKERGNTVFESLSINDLASCLSSSGAHAASLETLRGSIARFEQRRWPFRQGMLLTTLALTHSQLGEDSNAINDCKSALERYPNAPRQRAKVRQLMGIAYRHLGDLETGLASLKESTQLFLTDRMDSAELAYNYLSGSDFQRLRGNHSLALLYAQEAIRFSKLSKSPSRTAQALSSAAVEHARLGQFEEGRAQLTSAFDSVKQTGKSQRNFTEQLVLTRAAEFAARRGDIAGSVDSYSQAEKILKKGERLELSLIAVLRGRAEAYLAARKFSKARIDLDRAIALIEKYRSHIIDAKDRSAYLDASHSVFDQMILLNVRGFGRWPEAFAFSEQSRARTLLDALSLHRPVTRVRLEDVRRVLPADLTLLTYSVTDHGTFVFIITPSGLQVVELTATAEVLDRMVNDYVSGLKSKAPLEEVSEKARELHRYLIEPLRPKLGNAKRLCIVPDKALHFLPFAALIDETGRYLVESYSLSSAPSASALVQCIEGRREKGTTADEKILAVGNPAFDREAFPLLPDLPDAEREASESASFYGSNKVVLIGASADKRRLRAELEDCNVAHLAVHCLVEANSPSLAALVLASDRSTVPNSQASPGDGLLSLNEIYGMSLPKTNLVVLSACQSGLGRYYRGEGIVSLVRPFLALRVPTVVASLWSVDSQSTASLMVEFHRLMRTANAGPGEALRISQIRMAGTEEHKHPYYWAPFAVIGDAY